MKALDALKAIGQRARRPRNWGAALLFGLAWNVARLLLAFPAIGLTEALTPALWAFLLLVLAPVPWQWTGEERPLAGTLRGLLQALPWMAALTVAALWLMAALAPAPPPGGPGQGRGGGRGMRGSREEVEARHPRPHSPFLHLIPSRFWLLGVGNLSFGLLLGWILADRERAESEGAAAQAAARAAQTRALQAQMNPHVLFNAISGLTELVREDPQAAEQALVNLAGLLRGLMEHGGRLRAPLREERELVQRLLELERLRLGKRLREQWDWPESLDGVELPPLLVQPLVENALKHGISLARGGGELAIRLWREGSAILIRVANTGPEPQPEATGGSGLRNLRERLALQGCSPEAFQLRREGDWTVAELRLEVPE